MVRVAQGRTNLQIAEGLVVSISLATWAVNGGHLSTSADALIVKRVNISALFSARGCRPAVVTAD
jgi:hypothetical protein